MAPLAAVTGATGFVGRRLVGALADHGWRVRILARQAPPAGPHDDVISGDLGNAEALRRLTDGAAVVIHCAGLIKARDRAAFHAVNVDGAAAVARASAGRRLLLVSSLAAREPSLSAYAESKRAGEEACRAIAGGALTIVRPPAIYGPGDRATLGIFQAAAASPLLPLPGSPDARLALAHVDDVCAEIAFLAGQPSGPGPYTPAGARPQGYGWREIFSAAAAAVGRHPRRVPAPAWLVRAAGLLADLAALREPLMFGSGKAREILHPDWSVSAEELAPGAPPARFELAEGFADTVAWYRAHGWLGQRSDPLDGPPAVEAAGSNLLR